MTDAHPLAKRLAQKQSGRNHPISVIAPTKAEGLLSAFAKTALTTEMKAQSSRLELGCHPTFLTTHSKNSDLLM
ncbi:hypothetical protein [Rhizobium sp. BK491]|uniref:hypothetical protein n=1 Tax=Rhizobium sp. BK491 TaxID=2587009 RepID=UPI00160824F4|nr:hypothetical protein [Rhizobium sp. BK491]MBB3572009.1 hypothetical protein [Rhizobium sp. BK491]